MNSFEEFWDVVQREGLEGVGLYYGFYRGRVEDNNDPKTIGRLKITCPALYGDDVYPEWILPRGIVAGAAGSKPSGIYWIPPKLSPVYITCENGNVRFPHWEYGWFLSGNDIDSRIAGATPGVHVFQTPLGHRIELNDNDNFIEVKNSTGFHVKLYDDGISIGKDAHNLGKFLTDLFTLFEATTVATPAGASPFNNVIDYTTLKNTITDFLKTT